MEALLEAEGFERYNLTSPVQWVGELKDLREARTRAQAFGGVFVGMLVVLIFGSIAVFEYRQNIFATALFKSFGLSSLHLAARYLVESLLLLGLAFCCAVELGKLIHEFVFVLAGFDSELAALGLLSIRTCFRISLFCLAFWGSQDSSRCCPCFSGCASQLANPWAGLVGKKNEKKKK